jgi:4-hydroxybenzoate polyprenyltransferase
LLYASTLVWAIGYDTIYALQDARDDAIVGIRSTARLFRTRVKLGVGAFYVATAGLALAAIESAGGGHRVARMAGFLWPSGLANVASRRWRSGNSVEAFPP